MARALEERDPLTGLLHVDRMLAAVRDGPRSGIGLEPAFAAIVIDVDRFRRVNDAFGPAAGDAMLAAVATRIASVTGTATLSRRSAEFTALLPPTIWTAAVCRGRYSSWRSPRAWRSRRTARG